MRCQTRYLLARIMLRRNSIIPLYISLRTREIIRMYLLVAIIFKLKL